jgi:hypothetical protein
MARVYPFPPELERDYFREDEFCGPETEDEETQDEDELGDD